MLRDTQVRRRRAADRPRRPVGGHVAHTWRRQRTRRANDAKFAQTMHTWRKRGGADDAHAHLSHNTRCALAEAPQHTPLCRVRHLGGQASAPCGGDVCAGTGLSQDCTECASVQARISPR
jgi:hypothetical protein